MTLKNRLLLTVAVLFATLTAVAEIPARYYSSINGKKDAELKTALCNLIYNHTEVSSYSALPQYFQRTDVYPDSRRWWDMYSDIPLYAPSFSGLNREHSFPKSWWGGSQSTPAYVDLNHLYPSEMEANMQKSNYPLSEVSTATYDNGVVKVGYAVSGQGGGASKVFEPADEYKGDFARTYFYMVTCYQNLTWNRSYMWMLQQNTYPTLSPWAVQLLLRWHRDDPVSDKEINRNEAVYKIQNNRNPFIDYPQLAEYIWGTHKGEAFYESSVPTEPVGDPILITPVQDMSLDFNETAVGRSTTSRLFFKGENLRGTLSVVITKPRGYENDDRANFSVDTKSIQTSLVNREEGFWLTVTYKPLAVGSHYARLVVSDGGLDGSLGIALRGEGCPVPELSAFRALPAEDVTSTGYVAAWEEPADVVDYYIVTRTRYTQGASGTTEELTAETNRLPIDDYDPSVAESYHVQSVRLGFRSPESNEVYVETGGIDAVTGDVPLSTAYEPGGVRFICGTPHTDVTFHDMQGRTVTVVDYIENNSVVMLPPGVYIVTTRQCHRPVKVVVH